MSSIKKRWQTKIWLGDMLTEPMLIYGESLEQLQIEVANWLREQQPATFSNTPAHYNIPHRVKHYLYSDGTIEVQLDSRGSRVKLAEGWYVSQGMYFYHQPQWVGDFEALIVHFIEQGMIAETGPDYNDRTVPANKQHFLNDMVPLLYGAMFGLFSAICYLAIPFHQGDNFVLNHLKQGQIILPVFFLLIMIGIFMLVSLLILVVHRRK